MVGFSDVWSTCGARHWTAYNTENTSLRHLSINFDIFYKWLQWLWLQFILDFFRMSKENKPGEGSIFKASTSLCLVFPSISLVVFRKILLKFTPTRESTTLFASWKRWMHQFLLDQISDKINFWFTLVHCNYQLELISMEAQHDEWSLQDIYFPRFIFSFHVKIVKLHRVQIRVQHYLWLRPSCLFFLVGSGCPSIILIHLVVNGLGGGSHINIYLHPGKLTWIPKMTPYLKPEIHFEKPSIFDIHVRFRWGTLQVQLNICPLTCFFDKYCASGYLASYWLEAT